jgi:hypothetical protein
VDMAVLGVSSQGEVCMSPTGKRGEHPSKTPSTWVRVVRWRLRALMSAARWASLTTSVQQGRVCRWNLVEQQENAF